MKVQIQNSDPFFIAESWNELPLDTLIAAVNVLQIVMPFDGLQCCLFRTLLNRDAIFNDLLPSEIKAIASQVTQPFFVFPENSVYIFENHLKESADAEEDEPLNHDIPKPLLGLTKCPYPTIVFEEGKKVYHITTDTEKNLLEKITFDEWVYLMQYFEMWQQKGDKKHLFLALAVLYRPEGQTFHENPDFHETVSVFFQKIPYREMVINTLAFWLRSVVFQMQKRYSPIFFAKRQREQKSKLSNYGWVAIRSSVADNDVVKVQEVGKLPCSEVLMQLEINEIGRQDQEAREKEREANRKLNTKK